MKIKVLLADDSDVLRSTVVAILKEEPDFQIAEAANFAQTVQMIADFKPDVLVFDLHMAEKRNFAATSVKAQLACVDRAIAISFASDDEATSLAGSYGATILLDKMKLYTELIPAIKNLAPFHDRETAA